MTTVAEEIRSQITQLSLPQQQQVLVFIQTIKRPQAASGAAIIHLAGAIPPDDIAVMRQVADEECERIDHNAW